MHKILLFLICLIPLFLDENELSFYEPINYLIFFIFYIIKVLKNKKTFFYPSSLFIIYICLNYTFGSFLYNGNLFDDYLNGLIDHRLSLKRITINNFFLFFSIVYLNYKFKLNRTFINKFKFDFKNSKIVFVYGIMLMLTFSFLDFNLDFIGGEGSLSNIPKSIGAIILFIYASKNRAPYKYLIYISVFLIMSYVSFEDKREAILLVLTYVILEYKVNLKTFKLKDFFQLFTISFLSLTLIIVMSIKRGYGDFVKIDDSENIFELFPYVPQYISSDFFLASLANNLEVSYSYAHSNRAVDYAIKNDVLLLGSTFLKPLFLFVPRAIFKSKPQSMIDRYTKTFSSQQRANGVSWPVNFIAEFFWNFSYFGFILIIPFLAFFDTLFSYFFDQSNKIKTYSIVLPLFMMNQWIVLVRGSGLEHFLLDFIIGSIFIIPLFKLPKSLND